ncbi:MAG: OmpA family protein [Bacteroidota bacterium]
MDKALDKATSSNSKKKENADISQNSNDHSTNNKSLQKENIDSKDSIEVWTKRYDFKAGTEIIFFDDFENEEIGEIPTKWHYTKGLVETVSIKSKGKAMSGEMAFLRPNWEKDYTLPDQYTIEFDIFLSGDITGAYNYGLFFGDENYRRMAAIYTYLGEMSLHNVVSGKYEGYDKADLTEQWHHISISVNKNNVKGYFNEFRMFNSRFPNGKIPKTFWLKNCCYKHETPYMFMMDNFKIAVGKQADIKQEIISGKFISHSIHFNYNSDQIVARSYAEINRIADMLKENPEINLSIEGHTDSDGSEEYNLSLSKKRANAVRAALLALDVNASRLISTGHGESKPIMENSSSEGKAMNRRVEFIRT